MNLIRRMFNRNKDAETRSLSLASIYGAGLSSSDVTPERVLSNLAVAARCVGLRSEMLASVGLHLFKRTAEGGRERADENALYGVLHDAWNDNLSAFEGRETMIRALDLHGNAFARIERADNGQVTALYPLQNSQMTVEKLASGRLRYRISERGGGTTLLQDDVLHVRGVSPDGVLGLSPLNITRGALGLALSQNDTAASLVKSGLRPSGTFTYPERLNPEAKMRMRSLLEEGFSGGGNAGRFLMLDGGAKFEQLSWSPEDAEFLETRKLSNLDVARVFGCPPTTVGIPDHGTYSNQEQESTALVRNALGPLAARIEGALMRCLLTPDQRRVLYIEHDLSSLLRGDVKARFEAYRIGREIGALSPNDIRRRENDPPITAGDTYHQPANWVPLGTVAASGGNA
jgi:HK97 family phage portal protein